MTMMHLQQGKSQQRQTNQPKHSRREQLPDTPQKWRKLGGKEREREREREREIYNGLCILHLFCSACFF